MAQARAEELEALVAAAQNAGGCETAVASLEADLKTQQKVIEQSKNPSLRGIESTRGYIGRQKKKCEGVRSRMVELQKEIEVLECEVVSITTEIQESEMRLQRMESEASKTMCSTVSGLEDAVRMLMVAMHSCQDLPPKLAGAVEAVSKCLPVTGVSEDGRGMAVDGVELKEEEVPAAQLDAAIPPDRIEIEPVLEELSHDNLLVWAKERRRVRAKPY